MTIVALEILFDHRPEWGNQVVRNKDKTVKHPMEINVYMAFILGTICCVSFALNFDIILRILCDTKMRLKPRYIVQLGIAFSDLFVLFGIAIVIFHFSFGPNETVCNFYVAFFLGRHPFSINQMDRDYFEIQDGVQQLAALSVPTFWPGFTRLHVMP